MAHLYVCDRCDKRDKDLNRLKLISVRIPLEAGDKFAELCEGCRIELARMIEPIPQGLIARG